MKQLAKRNKVDIALVSQDINNTNVTGRWYKMDQGRKALVIATISSMAAGTTATLDILQAQDGAGTGSKAISGATATVTANTNVTEMTVTYGTPTAGDTITVNGVILTCAASTDTTAKTFADAAGLTSCININCAGLTATNSSGTITIKVTDAGSAVITASKTGTALTLATTQVILYVEVDVSSLDVANNFYYVAAKFTTTANTDLSVVIERGDARWEPVQYVAASAQA